MKIWFDILTPKQLLFFEPMVKKLKKKHNVLCTSRNYREVSHLAKIRRFSLVFVGKHGGFEKYDKLTASVNRISKLTKIIRNFSPDIIISSVSPEAARISFGLGIKHITFTDSPHAEAVMRLTLPFVQKLLIPWIIPKNQFAKYGIMPKDIIHYKAIDASLIAGRKIQKNYKIPFNTKKKTVMIRLEEEQAAYSKKKRKVISIIRAIVNNFKKENIVVLARYPEQILTIKNLFGGNVIVLKMSYDGKLLLQNSDVFIGSGGTMTAEAAFLGIPTISYNAVPNFIEDYLVKKKLVRIETNSKKIVELINHLLKSSSDNKRLRKRILSEMEDPYKTLLQVIRNIR